MTAMYPTLPKLNVRDSIDDDDLTDIDDEVFIRDGRNGMLKLDDESGVKRPLMAPRRKNQKTCNMEQHAFPCRALFVPLCYGFAALIILIGLIILCIFTANIFPMPLTILKNWLSHELKVVNKSDVVPCTSLASKIVWTRSLPKLTSEAPLRSNDVNGDDIKDIIIGFSTGLDTMDAPEYVCALYFGNQAPCLGGVLALDGITGETIWTHWTAHAIFSVDCALDLTNDKIKDCVISGRGGILQAVNGHDGSTIWEIPIEDVSTSEQQKVLDVYDAKCIMDINEDGIGDVIASHAIQSNAIRSSQVLMISGQNGNILHSITLPETEQLFTAPQILVHPDGENIFILSTSSQVQSGGLYVVHQVNLMHGDLKLKKLPHGTGKGALLSPILVDINLDGIDDIVVALFNSTVMAYDGLTFNPLWNYTIPNSEVISIPIPGYYNDDNIPDFMVKHQIGSGFPTYYYTVAMIIDGQNGKPLLEKPMEDSLSRQMSGVSITVDGFGNDWFLHWSADCLNYEGIKEKYQFLKGHSLISQTRADLCKLRFNSTLTTRLYALSQHVGPPGVTLYFSEDWRSLEFNNSIDPRIEAEQYLEAHPDFEVMDAYADIPFVSERSPEIHKIHKQTDVLDHKADSVFDNFPSYTKLSDVAYQNVNNYKGQEKHNSNLFKADNVEDFNVNDNWRRVNKWSGKNIPSDKEYDVLYDGDSNNNKDDGSDIDYPQEVREQRSDSNDNSNVLTGNTENQFNLRKLDLLENSRQLHKIFHENSTLINPTLAHNQIPLKKDTIKRKRTLNNPQTEKLKTPSSLSKEKNVLKHINTFELQTNPLNVYIQKQVQNFTSQSKGSEISDKEVVLKGVQGILENKNINMSQDSKDNSHNFSSNVQNKEDTTVVRIYKQDSIKMQNVKLKDKSFISDVNIKQYQEKLRMKRVKRKTHTESNQAFVGDGVQRQPPTGILLPSLSTSKGISSIDLVFSTFWLPSSDISLILLQEDLDCIHKKKALSENKLQYQDNDDFIKECLFERGINYKLYQEAMNRENVKITLGQMTIYRMKLECVCPEDMLPNQICKNISIHQSWPEHLGFSGNGFFKPLQNSRL